MLQVNAVSEGDEAYGQDYGLITTTLPVREEKTSGL